MNSISSGIYRKLSPSRLFKVLFLRSSPYYSPGSYRKLVEGESCAIPDLIKKCMKIKATHKAEKQQETTYCFHMFFHLASAQNQ